jgi:hypothetical protein
MQRRKKTEGNREKDEDGEEEEEKEEEEEEEEKTACCYCCCCYCELLVSNLCHHLYPLSLYYTNSELNVRIELPTYIERVVVDLSTEIVDSDVRTVR